ncbi:class I adenylate-forming enzyme family protein [Arthrobacter globiformis]|uniref:class I adenylate-forming enzyme family protein n=1 Tax=Arthrobacter globiformis TaxID=1665 RepID=UPI00278CC8BE|nr:class I adenylate-forming enzyme family protein [Arthrobacter globiformis]MDQ0616668.1 long-chain acyl-CoA synthetase [Arthrobacter globiformis]
MIAEWTGTRWGREVVEGVVAGHPCLQYAKRSQQLGEFLIDAGRWGDREFMVQGERRLTYRQFLGAVDAVRNALAERGMTHDSRIALLAFNSVEWVVTFWATQVLGATVVLGNAWWSDNESTTAFSGAGVDLVVTHRDLDLPTMAITDVRRVIDASTPASVIRLDDIDEEALAMIMFSSGTTGLPKGVKVPHRSLIANIHNVLILTGRLPSELPDDHPGTVSLLTVPLFHLAGLQISLTTLLSGGRLVFLEGKFDPAQVLELIQRERVRTWGGVPTMVGRVLDHPHFGQYDTSSVKSVPMGGSAISQELRNKVASGFSGVRQRVGSLYGMTETGVLAAGSGQDVAGRRGCVGKVLPAVQIRIKGSNEDGSGEIQALTPAVTGGYLDSDEPIGDAEGWVSTGDLGYLDEEGYLFVTGRSKDVIIRGGENIASVHVEESLESHPEVLEVAVVGLPHADLGEEVGAAVVLRTGSTATTEDLRIHAASTLGRFEIPSRWWLRTEKLPTNATGKVLRRQVAQEWALRTSE